ncbi:hypothetical protein HOC87_11600 [Candidatus Bathyarchaeota archaeon]|jgi:cytoskeletal protein CcmA (bactofilin family)|nr:hypothetical protein [Candidatus Bathyarchaeota archaeon]MBT4424989.1 hypothetical protein [Candidatus Bathyarchaeota archaeon]MBT6603755.1 hypothetical protein [Candidatus Bathyarchaeota archaeon]
MEYSEIPTSKISGSGRLTVPGHGIFKISGSGRISPELIKTSGSSKIPGGLKVGEVKTSGSSKIEGDIEAEFIKVSGSATVEGSVTCEDIEKSGSLRIEKDLNCESAQFSGSTSIEGFGRFKKELRNSGSIRFGEDIESEGPVRFSGSIEVDGKITAKSLEGRLGRKDSNVREGIEADYVDIRPGRNNWRDEGYLITSDIVGKEILLENVECNNVTGDKVTIMQGCRVNGHIKYRESVQVAPGTKMDSEPEKIE